MADFCRRCGQQYFRRGVSFVSSPGSEPDISASPVPCVRGSAQGGGTGGCSKTGSFLSLGVLLGPLHFAIAEPIGFQATCITVVWPSSTILPLFDEFTMWSVLRSQPDLLASSIAQLLRACQQERRLAVRFAQALHTFLRQELAKLMSQAFAASCMQCESCCSGLREDGPASWTCPGRWTSCILVGASWRLRLFKRPSKARTVVDLKTPYRRSTGSRGAVSALHCLVEHLCAERMRGASPFISQHRLGSLCMAGSAP